MTVGERRHDRRAPVWRADRVADVAALPSFLILVAATVAGCWLFYLIGRNIGWLRPLIGLRR